jgi:hypothetical protein
LAKHRTPDGKGLYCGSYQGLVGTILYVDLKGNARVLWQFKGTGGPVWGIPSPDGRYLAMRNQAESSNVWMRRVLRTVTSDKRRVARTEVRSKESEASHRNRGRGWMKNDWLYVGTLTQRRPRTSWRETLVASWLSVQHEGASYGLLWHL